MAHQVLLQLINPTFPRVWEYYWVTLFFFNGQTVLEQFARHKQAIVMNQSKKTVLSSKSSEIAKSKQPAQPSSQTHKNIPKSQCPGLALDRLFFARFDL